MTSNFDRLIGILGLVVAILTFIAQGPYESRWQYALPIAPIAAAILVIGFHKALPRITHYQALYGRTRLLTATHLKSSLTIQVNNEAGDATLSRWYRMELTRNGVEIHEGKNEVLVSKTAVPSLPPGAVIKRSSNGRQALTPSAVDQSRIEVAGRTLWRYVWHYRLSPALVGKGAFLEYAYAVDVPGAEAAAFGPDGSLFSVEHGTINMQVVNAKLIAPAHHSIEIMECYVENRDGNQHALPAGEGPALTDSGELMVWNPPLRIGSRYVCRYRMINNRTGRVAAATAGEPETAAT